MLNAFRLSRAVAVRLFVPRVPAHSPTIATLRLGTELHAHRALSSRSFSTASVPVTVRARAASAVPTLMSSAQLVVDDLCSRTSRRSDESPSGSVPTAAECAAGIATAINGGVDPQPLVHNIVNQLVPVPVSFELASSCLNAAVLCRDMDLVLRVAEYCAANSLVPEVSVCELAITTACMGGHHALTVRLFELMVSKGLDASQTSCVYAAQAYVYMGKPAVTLQLLAQLCKEDAVVLPEVFTTTVETLTVAGHDGIAFQLFELGASRGVQLGSDAVGDLICLCCSNPTQLHPLVRYCLKWNSLYPFAVRERVLHAMVGLADNTQLEVLLPLLGEEGVVPTARAMVSNLLLSVFGRTNNFRGAAAVWESMRKLAIVPSEYACAVWMAALNKADKPGEAIAVFDRMLANKMQPDNYVLTSVLKACAKLNDYDRAKLYWRALQRKQGTRRPLLPDIASYNALIYCCVGVCARSDALNLLDQLRNAGCTPNESTFRGIILACAATNSPQIAFSVYDDMRVEGIAPGEPVFSALLQACAVSQSAALTHETVGLMSREKFKPTASVCAQLIYCFAVGGDAAEAAASLHKLRRLRVPSETQYAEAMGAAAAAGDWELIEELRRLSVVDEIVDSGLISGQIIRCLATIGKVDEAFKMLADMFHDHKNRRLYLPAFCAVFSACTSQELLEQCFELTGDVLAHGSSVSVAVLDALAQACITVRNAELAIDVLRLLDKTTLLPSNDLYNTILLACVNENRPDIAQDVVDHMANNGVRPTATTFQILSKAEIALEGDACDSDGESSGSDADRIKKSTLRKGGGADPGASSADASASSDSGSDSDVGLLDDHAQAAQSAERRRANRSGFDKGPVVPLPLSGPVVKARRSIRTQRNPVPIWGLSGAVADSVAGSSSAVPSVDMLEYARPNTGVDGFRDSAHVHTGTYIPRGGIPRAAANASKAGAAAGAGAGALSPVEALAEADTISQPEASAVFSALPQKVGRPVSVLQAGGFQGSAALDETTTRLNKHKMSELKELLVSYGLKVSGNKSVLVSRLVDYLLNHPKA